MIQFSTFFLMLIICAIDDIKTREVKVIVIYVFAIIGICIHLFSRNLKISDILGGMAVGMILVMINKLFKNSIGIGDGMIVMVAGIYLGVNKTVELLIYSMLLSGIFAVFLLVVRKKEKNYEIPFVPFLLLGYMGVFVL